MQIIASATLQYTLSAAKLRKVCFMFNGMYKFSKDLLECTDISSPLEQVTVSRVVKARKLICSLRTDKIIHSRNYILSTAG
jgi:hypothetical protein